VFIEPLFAIPPGCKPGFSCSVAPQLKAWRACLMSGLVQTKLWRLAKFFEAASKEFFEAGSKEFAVISESFDRRTLSKMEIALERACLILPAGCDKHEVRRIIAGKILECAHRGDKTLSDLTAAGYAAVTQLSDPQSKRWVG
jgi:hypothetical protein